ncbi:RNA-binding domain-containing protein [Suhomyces tanzawaensis NRRL Y-17324]|uniref:RNA-binding domain-containing protein n=1 Tax=Suhomyces tanzawaensis NRRL Y-17324 TaxID=984487 RepID=A0A1E4SPH6_9ASCO|nr:RNA-binding domain-containing protein [Suhomyces tanzawaensis NRRL Y-17324]ODV81292.1 RNA-binding domain-containing protein [Suhomyces tanzawaensis NRRL Y-17324]
MSDQVPIQQQQLQQPYAEQADVLLPQAPTEDEDIQITTGDHQTKHLDDEVARLKAVLSENPHAPQTDEEKRDIDSRSVYIGNVDYAATPAELQQHFASAGVVQRVTILLNKFTGQPKGFAYLEFADTDGVNKAVATLDGSSFRDRELKVSAKRTNIPGLSTTNRGRGGHRGRGGFRGRGGRGRGRGGSFRGAPRFTPY